jgi:hypothetical protein
MRAGAAAAVFVAVQIALDSIDALAASPEGQSARAARTQTISDFTKSMTKIGGFCRFTGTMRMARSSWRFQQLEDPISSINRS